MTDLNTVLSEEAYQALLELRSSIDAIVCASDLISSGGEGNDYEALGFMFRILSARIESDLTAFFNSLCLSRS
ncbi:hypothetical protein DOA20_26965 [Salmonella enterica subsp. enterica serovar Newport]|nr:hypothetical protein [Salmonella enterica subsp. enterica serovar Newport]